MIMYMHSILLAEVAASGHEEIQGALTTGYRTTGILRRVPTGAKKLSLWMNLGEVWLMGLDLQGDEEEVGLNFIRMNSSVRILPRDPLVARVHQWATSPFLANPWLKITLGRPFYVKGFLPHFLMSRLRVFLCRRAGLFGIG